MYHIDLFIYTVKSRCNIQQEGALRSGLWVRTTRRQHNHPSESSRPTLQVVMGRHELDVTSCGAAGAGMGGGRPSHGPSVPKSSSGVDRRGVSWRCLRFADQRVARAERG